MTTANTDSVRAPGDLSIGDSIEAWHNGRLYHRGTVIRTVAATELFWIRDAVTGGRRLLDMEALEIVRVPEPVADAAVSQPTAAAPVTAYPLFQDGTQAIA